MTTSPNDYTGQLLTYLQAWRQYLEQATSGPAPGQPGPTAPWPILPMPPVSPPGPPMPPVAAPAGPLSPSSAPAPPPGDAVPPTPTYESRAYRRAETSGADGERSVQEADQPSLYDSRLTKLPPGPVPDRRPGSAYPWAGGPTSSGTPATAAARPLYSSPATSSGTPATAAQPLYSSPATSSPRPALGVETVAPNDDESSFFRPRPIPGRFPSQPEERGGTDGVEITGADPQA
jgi:hypothetical protein